MLFTKVLYFGIEESSAAVSELERTTEVISEKNYHTLSDRSVGNSSGPVEGIN